MEKKDPITTFFTTWTYKKLTKHFGEKTQDLLEFAEEFLMICLNDISHLNPAHITNKYMRRCLLKFDEWGQHTAVGNRALIWKMMHNAEILCHQCKQYKWYKECDEDHEAKAFIDAGVEKNKKGQTFIEFLQSMYLK